MGTKLIIPKADFSKNAIQESGIKAFVKAMSSVSVDFKDYSDISTETVTVTAESESRWFNIKPTNLSSVSLKEALKNQENLIKVSVGVDEITNIGGMCAECSGLESAYIYGNGKSLNRDLSTIFYDSSVKTVTIDINNFRPTHLDNLCLICRSVEEVDLSNLDLSNNPSMNNAFNGCENLRVIHIESKAGNMSSTAFTDCKKLDFVYVDSENVGSNIVSILNNLGFSTYRYDSTDKVVKSARV